MTEEKKKRLAAAGTVSAILLLVILVAVIIYQVTQITILSARRKQIKQDIEILQQKTERAEDTLEYFKSYSGLLDKAYEYGFVFDKSK